jgi:ribosomal protein L10
MKLPLIKTLSERFDEDYLLETIEVLEALAEVPSLKDKELEVIGELISNTLGAVEVIGIMRDSNGKKMLKRPPLNL